MSQKLTVCLFVLMQAHALAQTPDVAIKVDLNLSYTQSSGDRTRLRWYDPMGRHSTIGVGMNLEPGYYLLITERLSRIDSDIDREQIDEAYVEDPGSWRIGRQYLPFGARNLLREAALGIRLDTNLLAKAIPMRMVAFDNGSKKLRGFLVRIGDSIGVTAAIGQHLGAAGTSFGQIRDPQLSSGPGSGYRVAAALDTSRQYGLALVSFEVVALRQPHRSTDRSEDYSDLAVKLSSPEGNVISTLGWTRAWKTRDDFFRAESELKISRNVALKGFLRFQRSAWRDLSVGLRIRL